MSRIGKKSVAIPSGVTVTVAGGSVKVSGSKGELGITLLSDIAVTVEGDQVTVRRTAETTRARECHGLTRALIANMVHGVHEGYEKKLELIGVGYKAQVKGKTLVLNLGFSHPVEYSIPQGVEILPDEKNKNILTVRGIDKERVGHVAAQIRSFRPPEPYKGKGIRYVDEYIRRKVGKAAVKTA
ncbi:50S ribosomal protein L6 [Candidatus Peribacteria bacterium RIFCSPHIGHO2_01_FULL_51_9]|nr:MAG: 50S ribosomal protein L6 [Candidatus Peribacteria bacterium RIFCSPHIGHO2_01_FULL_51_9]